MPTATISVILTILIATLPLSQCGKEPFQLARSGLPMVDSLLSSYDAIRSAAEETDTERLLGLMEPDDAVMLRELSTKQGYNSLKSYLSYQMSGWPDPDTLSIVSVKRYGQFARLTLAGQASSIYKEYPVIRYTAILFKNHNGQWRLSAITSIEKNRYDLYGQEITVHNTDYPPRFRLPRLF